MMMWVVLGALLASAVSMTAVPAGAFAQAEAEADASFALDGTTTVTGKMRKDPLERWWLGGYYRHLWIPKYVTKTFLDRAPSFTNSGFGGLATYHSDGGLNVIFGIGYMPYEYAGPVLDTGGPERDTELVKSDLALIHVSAALMWDLEFHPIVALELGFGVDFGFLTGKMHRNEAYIKDGQFVECPGPVTDPMHPDAQSTNILEACSVPRNGGATDPTTKKGEHYDVNDENVPPVMGYLAIPQIALRLKPWKHMAIKAEFGFGLATLWAGASLHFSFGMFASDGPTEVVVDPDAAPAPKPEPEPVPPPIAAPVEGRVLGRVVDAESNAPIASATVTIKTTRALSPLSSLDDGRFVVDRLDPGMVGFEVQHEDYEPGKCEVEITDKGGDVPVICKLKAKPTAGAISGMVKNEKGKAVGGASVVITGPKGATTQADDQGSFAAVDMPPGMYQIQVEAPDYLLKQVEVEVLPRETALPEVILAARPKKELVKVSKKEIIITEQIQFATGSAEIRSVSHALMAAIADVLLRHKHVEQVEIQGHTDNRGKHSFNMKLSQDRAESVRAWLVGAGVEPDRLVARGYGPDVPIASNKSKSGRAQNRRVQFIIMRQSL